VPNPFRPATWLGAVPVDENDQAHAVRTAAVARRPGMTDAPHSFQSYEWAGGNP
jgi:hypothetical protein